VHRSPAARVVLSGLPVGSRTRAPPNPSSSAQGKSTNECAAVFAHHGNSVHERPPCLRDTGSILRQHRTIPGTPHAARRGLRPHSPHGESKVCDGNPDREGRRKRPSMVAGHFETQPRELEEAAQIDGASAWGAFRYVALPLARPGIVVGFILSFIFSWNNFIFGAVLAGRETRTLPVAVYNVLTFEQLAWGPLAAAAIVVTLPVLLLTIVIQKEILTGMTAGGVKGG